MKTGGYAQYDDGNMRIVRIKAWRGCGGTHENEGWIYETNVFAFYRRATRTRYLLHLSRGCSDRTKSPISAWPMA